MLCTFLVLIPTFPYQLSSNLPSEDYFVPEHLISPHSSAETIYIWEHNLTTDFQQVFLNLTFASEYQVNQTLDFILDASINNGYIQFHFLQIFFLDNNKEDYASLESFLGGVATPGLAFHQKISLNFTRNILPINNSEISFKIGMYWNGTQFDQYVGDQGSYSVDLLSTYSDFKSEGSGIWFLFWEFPTVWMAIVVNGVIITLVLGMIIFFQKKKRNNPKETQKKR